LKLTDSNQLPWQVYTHPREGTAELKVLAAAESSPGMNFFFILVRYGSHETFQTPRHHHTFEQIRYSVDGALNYAKGKDLPEGWIGYFPAGAYYGPQRVERGIVLGVQFGHGYLNEEQKARAQAELAALGTFHNGIYSYVDDSGKSHNKDGMEAMWEHIHGRALEYPEPRYPEPVLMNPAAFSYVPTDLAGIEEKHLGTFTERRVGMRFLRWTQDATAILDPNQSQLGYLTSGEAVIDAQCVGAGAALWSEHGEATQVAGIAGSEMLIWDLPGAA
jgi:hypothetical protein